MAIKKKKKGTTLVELMVVVGLIGILITAGPQLMSNVFRLYRSTEARTDVQRDARVSLNLIQGLLRRASAATITITRQNTDEPPYSKITFQTPDGTNYQFYQMDNALYFYHQDPSMVTHHRELIKNVRFITFGFPQISEDSLLSVAICFEKGTYGGQTKNFYLSTQRVQVMNS